MSARCCSSWKADCFGFSGTCAKTGELIGVQPYSGPIMPQNHPPLGTTPPNRLDPPNLLDPPDLLDPMRLDRHARHIVLPEIGGVGVVRLTAAHVVLVGMGGIGCPALQYLAGAGIGRLTLIDDDSVDLSNLQRQTLFTPGDIGQPKADCAARWVQAFDPGLAVCAIAERITPANARALLSDAHVILDGTDNFATRLLVSDTATALHIPLVSAAIGRFQGQIGTFRGWLNDSPCYRCFVGDAFDAEDCDTCADQGVLGAMVGLVGSFAAMEAVRAITGFGDDTKGKLHLFDGLKPLWRTLKISKDPQCATCGNQSPSPGSGEK